MLADENTPLFGFLRECQRKSTIKPPVPFSLFNLNCTELIVAKEGSVLLVNVGLWWVVLLRQVKVNDLYHPMYHLLSPIRYFGPLFCFRFKWYECFPCPKGEFVKFLLAGCGSRVKRSCRTITRLRTLPDEDVFRFYGVQTFQNQYQATKPRMKTLKLYTKAFSDWWA